MLAFLHIMMILAYTSAGIAYEIEPSDDMVYIQKGETVVLPCVVTGNYDVGSVPVIWKKYMIEEDKVGMHVSGGSKIYKPFMDTSRYKVLYQPHKTNYTLQITNVKLDDAGMYVCVADKKEKTTYFYVVDPVTSVTFNGAANILQDVANNQNVLDYCCDREGILQCVASGGHPKPDVALYIEGNNNNVVALFAPHKQVNKTTNGNVAGLQHFDYTTTRFSNAFKLLPEHDGKTLRCVASVGHGVNDVEASVKLRVFGKPTFLPHDSVVHAPLGTENFEIKCLFRSRPMPELATWYAEATRVEIKNGTDGLYATVITKDNHFEATLWVMVVKKESFQNYILSVTNAVGTDNITIKLERAEGTGEVSGGPAFSHVVALLFCAVSTATFFL